MFPSSRFVFHVATACLALASTSVAQAPPELPREARATADQIKRLGTVDEYTQDANLTPVEQRRRVGEAARRFVELLETLAGQLPPASVGEIVAAEGHTMDAKLVAIAYDLKQRPRFYEELGRIYIEHAVRPWRSQTAPRLAPEHATEAYRLPWEFYLLSPRPENSSPAYKLRALKALAAVRNNASLVVLLHSYRTTCEGELRPHLRERQRSLLKTLTAFCNEQGMSGLLECVSLSENQIRPKAGEMVEWDAGAFAYLLLTEYSDRACWRKVIEEFPRDELAPAQAQLLEWISEKLGAQKQR